MNLERIGVCTHSKIVGWPHLLQAREEARRDGRCVVWTNGCFDLVHAGHVWSLQSAARFGDLLVVGINTDDSVRRLKGNGRPVMCETDRAVVVSAMACVDLVVLFDELTPETALGRLQPDIHCKGADYAAPDGQPIAEAHTVRSYGGRIEFVPIVAGKSTSRIIDKIRHGR